jgi:hypothetical protein
MAAGAVLAACEGSAAKVIGTANPTDVKIDSIAVRHFICAPINTDTLHLSRGTSRPGRDQ